MDPANIPDITKLFKKLSKSKNKNVNAVKMLNKWKMVLPYFSACSSLLNCSVNVLNAKLLSAFFNFSEYLLRSKTFAKGFFVNLDISLILNG